MTHEFTKAQLQELFLTVDEDKDGKINVDGLATLLKKLGKQDTYKPKLIRVDSL
jgi:Ca2+-binding EF-hand superfamily protein